MPLTRLWKRLSSRSPDRELAIVTGGRRTGTTLMNAVLCAEPDANLLGPEGQVLTRLLEAYEWGDTHFDPFGAAFFDSPKRYRDLYQAFCARLIEEAAKMNQNPRLLVLKNPEISRVLETAIELLPSAKFLVMVRDPRDQICSELEVGRRQLEAGQANRLAEHRDVAALGHALLSYYRWLPNRCERTLVVRYEDLVADWETTATRLARFLGRDLVFDPEAHWVRTSPEAGLDSSPSTSANYGRPLSQAPISRHRAELSREEIACIESVCEPLMAQFGYV